MNETMKNKDGLIAVIVDHAMGFSVAFKDEESGEFFPTAYIYKNVDMAREKARKVLGITN